MSTAPPPPLWRPTIGAAIATPITVGAIGAIAFPYWAALTLFGAFTLLLPSLTSSLAIAFACQAMSRSRVTSTWLGYLLAGLAFGLVSAIFWCGVLAYVQDWHLSFGVGDPMPGSAPADHAEEALSAALFFAVTGVVLGAWTALIYWLIRRPDRDPPNPDTRAP